MTCYVELFKIKQDICDLDCQIKQLSGNCLNLKGQTISSELEDINEKIKLIKAKMQVYKNFKLDYDALIPTSN